MTLPGACTGNDPQDFKPKDDTILIGNRHFAKVGKGSASKPLKLDAGAFPVGTKAHDGGDEIIHDRKSGAPYCDADGPGRWRR